MDSEPPPMMSNEGNDSSGDELFGGGGGAKTIAPSAAGAGVTESSGYATDNVHRYILFMASWLFGNVGYFVAYIKLYLHNFTSLKVLVELPSFHIFPQSSYGLINFFSIAQYQI